MCSASKYVYAEHAANHGRPFKANADIYFDTANHFAFKGKNGVGQVVDAQKTNGLPRTRCLPMPRWHPIRHSSLPPVCLPIDQAF
jgi:hypothetical protein